MNGEIYSAGNDREQAGQVFKVAAQMVRLEPELLEIIKIVDSTKTLACYANGSFYRAISAEAGNKHGLNPTMVIFDELAQAKNRELYNVLDTAMGARPDPLFMVISTQSNDPQHILSEIIDDGLNEADPSTVCHLYTIPEEEDHFDERNWKLANPALGDFRSLEDFRQKAQQAQRLPSLENSFRNLYCNQRINPVSPLIPRLEWTACRQDVEFYEGEDVILAVDLSATTDLTAVTMLSAGHHDDRIETFIWKPGKLLEEHSRRDRAQYDVWARQGFIFAPDTNDIDYGDVARHIAELTQQYNVLAVVYDRWKIKSLVKEFTNIGLESYEDRVRTPEDPIPPKYAGMLRLIPWGQGYQDMSPAVDEFEKSVINRRLKHSGNPALTFCVANAMVVRDPSGNRKLDKQATRFRIDAAVTTAMALGFKAKETPGNVSEPSAMWI